MRALILGILAALLLPAVPASAHPTPFSYLDVRVNQGYAEVDLVAHIIDIAHDLNIDPPEQLLNPEVLAVRKTDISRLLSSRFHLRADGTPLTAGPWSDPLALPERQSVRISNRFVLVAAPGTVTLEALMFPYDPQHQTFINFYESDSLALQAILDSSKTSVEFFSGSRQGVWAVIRKFDPAGQHNASVPPIFLSARASLQWIVPGIPESICSNCPTLKISYSATPAKCAANFDVAPAHRGGLPTIGVIPPGLGRTRRTMESSL